MQAVVGYINPELVAISVQNCQLFDDEVITSISKHCTKLSSISLTGFLYKVTSTGISSFAKNCNLKGLTIISSESYDASKEHIIDGSISTDDSDREWSIDDGVFTSFLEGDYFALEQLSLCGFGNITGKGLGQFLSHIASHLISLDLSELTAVNDDVLEVIGNTCCRLEDVCFSHCHLTDDGIKTFCSKCKMLQSINLSGCQDITDDSLIAISTNCSSSLRHIKFGWCLKVTERSLEALANNCQNLVSVDASQCALKHIPFEFLSLPLLQELTVQGCFGLRCPPLKEASKSLESCRQFLSRCNLQSLYRITFLGNQGSGKTSLMLSLPMKSPAVADSATEGVHIATWRPFNSGKG